MIANKPWVLVLELYNPSRTGRHSKHRALGCEGTGTFWQELVARLRLLVLRPATVV